MTIMTNPTQSKPTRAALEGLAERCEAATGPDRELDCAIARAVGAIPESAAYERTIKMGDMAWSNGCGYQIPAYTASLDAAMTLVPDGLRLTLSEWDDENHLRPEGAWQAILSKPGSDASFDAMRGYRCDHAATPALALTAAALRARAASEDTDRG